MAKHRSATLSGLALTATFILFFAQVSTASAAPSGQVAWIGSPVAGTVSSTPSNHAPAYGAQWATDIETYDQAVNVYVAADPGRDPNLSARILSVDYACGPIPGESSAGRLARGGKRVMIGVYYSGALIGRLYYAHVETNLPVGNHNVTVSRWGGTVGTVGSYRAQKKPDGSYCWTGRHVHFEASNQVGLSCYWSGLSARISRNQYIGYVGYKSPTKACPNGI
jgi:hypothetical protein